MTSPYRNLQGIALAIIFFLIAGTSVSQTKEINALQLSLKKVSDRKVLVDKYNRLAMLSQMRFRDSCHYYSLKALKIANDINYLKGTADALNCQGIYYLSTNNYLSAKYFNDALAIYRMIGDQENQAQLLMNMSVLMFVDNNRTEAKKYIYRAYEQSKISGRDSIQSIILSDILTMDGSLTNEARDRIFKKGLAVAQKYKDYPMIISYQNNLGTELYNKGEKLQGVRILTQSVKLAQREGSEYVKVSAYMTLGEMMLDLKRYKQGINYYELGMMDSEKFGYTERYLAFAERLYNFYKERKDTDKAFEYASMLLSKQSQYAESVKESGYNYLSYVSKESLLEKTKIKYREQKRLALFLALAVLAMLLLCFALWLALTSRKKYLESQQKLHNASLERNRELEMSDRFNMMLISILAHDIREPFSNISMITKFYNEGMISTEQEMKTVMSELYKITVQGISFMDGLLLWIRSRKENYSLPAEELMALEILREANQFFESTQKENAVHTAFDVPENFMFYAPRQIALFILRNLIHNATKYSAKGGTIKIRVYTENQMDVFAVQDKGKGMGAEALDSLFKADSASYQDSVKGGAGIALKISHEMLEKIGGRIWAESQIGEGTTFFVCFRPKKRVQ
ncbi:tetratricopeptide repeat-containing sensor histidine kinase [Flavobacterium phragmitis]|uniref:histidine kinase n=1 Tax=Flavobacterium phragmitis TaxID=739143 RepID=A0A1I1XM83_9FLAO|nr:HAMP domain-containing sensor histidine kinase [Flavobacterium phragmitis]SFE08437.1 Signal transduction histidine kinase [Flavobacterium phragmitis]